MLFFKALNSLGITLHSGYAAALLLFIWITALHVRRAWRDRWALPRT